MNMRVACAIAFLLLACGCQTFEQVEQDILTNAASATMTIHGESP